MRFPGLKAIRHSARWLRSRFSGGVPILGFHRVADVPIDDHHICVTPANFGEQMEALQNMARPIALSQLVESIECGELPRNAIVVTFDDGYADNLYVAKPILENYQIPATAFITTGYIGREFWWDELDRFIGAMNVMPNHIELTLGADNVRWSYYRIRQARGGEADCRHRLRQWLYHKLKSLSYVEREGAFSQLRSMYPASLRSPDTDVRAMTQEELLRILQGGIIEVGGHTVSHTPLVELPIDKQKAEIEESKLVLEELLGVQVQHFSYPHGAHSAETMDLVRRAGFRAACGSTSDIVLRRSDQYHLPRLWVPNCDGPSFRQWLEPWLSG